MSMKPILFNTDMVCAVRDNRKTVTRRLVKPQPDAAFRYCHETNDGEWFWTTRNRDDDMMGWWPSYEHGIKPPYQPGDILYVRETFKPWFGGYSYKADSKEPNMWTWKPSIHMPKEAARMFLRVMNVRVERLQQPFFDQGSTIFELQREGVDIGSQCRECIYTYGRPCCIDDESECGILDDVRDNFA